MSWCLVVNLQWTHVLSNPTTHITTHNKAIKNVTDVCTDGVFLHLCVTEPLVVHLIQDDHAIWGYRFLPRDVHGIFCHLVIDGTTNVISFVCRKQSHTVSQIAFLLKCLPFVKQIVKCQKANRHYYLKSQVSVLAWLAYPCILNKNQHTWY